MAVELLTYANREKVAQALTAQGYEVTRQTVNRWARGDEMPAVAAQMIARLFGHNEEAAPGVPERLNIRGGYPAFGFPLVAVAHLVVLPVLRNRILIAFALITPALWMTMALGNVLWFTIVIGVLALRGSRWASVATIVIFVLLPRPLMAPLVIWLLWKQPWLRLPAAGIVVAGVVANLLTGYTAEWIVAALNFSSDSASRQVWDWGPTRFFGHTWFVIGVPLAVVLTRKGHVGLAGLAISPYLAPVYLIALVFDLDPVPRPR